MSGAPDGRASIEVERDERAFLVEYEPSRWAGWTLREWHHDGCPIMAGPSGIRQDAIDGIDYLLFGRSLCCYEDENGDRSCWV